jgi:outer membrane protein OmpA-like peptidoglycan-associated protein
MQNLEVFAALLGSSSRNVRCAAGEACAAVVREDPEVIKSMGDIVLGGKYARALGNGFSAGGEAGLRFLSSATNLSLDMGATSLWFGGLASYDLRHEAQLPIRFHTNLGMYIDNSSSLIASNLQPVTQGITGFAYGAGRTRIRGAFGIDMPAQRVSPQVVLHPFAEYRIEHVTADANTGFAANLPGMCDQPGSRDICLGHRNQHTLGLGLGAQLFDGPIVSAGMEFATQSFDWTYGSRAAPYNVLVALTYPLDVRHPKIIKVVAEEKPEVAAPAVTTGSVAGAVTSAKDGATIADAVITVVGLKYGRTLSDADGTFLIADVQPGPVNLEVTAPNYTGGSAQAVVVAGQATRVAVALTPNKPASHLRGHVTVDGAGVQGALHLKGAQYLDSTTGPDGAYDLVVPAGEYSVRIDSAAGLGKEVALTVNEGEQKELNFALRPRPTRPRVALNGDTWVLKQPIAFVTERNQPTAELSDKSLAVLDEVIDLLLGHPQILKLRVEAHWDNGLPKKKADELTEAQSQAVMAYLKAQGIPASRLEGAGLGSSKPKVPNLGKAAKMLNRRIEFKSVN